MNEQMNERLQAKTPEQRFLRVLEDDFHQPPRVAKELLAEAQACLFGQASTLRPGQIRVLLARQSAGHGQPLVRTATQEVIWTIDAGIEDRQVQGQHGAVALRQVRIQRLLDEALEQGALATQEDLAHVLQVSPRTIKRDCKALEEQGVYLPTRGKLKGIGRGQTHKAQIVAHWIQGATYDQIQLHTRHSLTSIKRYVQTFVRVVDLYGQGFRPGEIALVLGLGDRLVGEYIALYESHDAPEHRTRLREQIERLSKGSVSQKGAL